MVRFTTKKIATLTLGEKLSNMRLERRLSLIEVSKHTKIQAKYLEYMESGEYTKLPADVYVKGFLRSWANYMGANELALIKQYEREKGIHKNIKKIENEEKSIKPINFSKFAITPKILILGGVLLSVIVIFFYLYREVNSFISQPRLVIMQPVDGAKVTEKVVDIKGAAEKDALVTINDQAVLVNEKGDFSQEVGLQPGINAITIKAKNRFDKESVKTISINADYQNPVSDQESQSGGNVFSDNVESFSLEVYVSPNPTWLSIESDDNLVYSGTLNPGSVQKIDAKEKIAITSGKGNETFVKMNGKELGLLSNDPGAANGIIFTAKGKEEKK